MHHYARTFDKATMEAPRYRVPFDKPFNLREKIATCLLNQQGHEQLDLAAYDCDMLLLKHQHLIW